VRWKEERVSLNFILRSVASGNEEDGIQVGRKRGHNASSAPQN